MAERFQDLLDREGDSWFEGAAKPFASMVKPNALPCLGRFRLSDVPNGAFFSFVLFSSH